jgi:hypothetical protein
MYRRLRMNWLRAITGVLVLWSSTAWGATLTWEANHESNLAGYNVYHCNRLPCTPKTGSSLLTTLGKDETSLHIGTPTEIHYYFITAYNRGNHESSPSNVVVFTPAGSPPLPPTPGSLRINSPK